MIQVGTEVCYQSFGGWEVQTMWKLRKMCDVYGKAYFSKKIFTNMLNKGLPPGDWIKKTDDGVDKYWLSRKEKDPGADLVKKSLTVIWYMK